jgi:hypothetical protein
MAIKKQAFKRYIERFNFSELFIDLGWSHKNQQIQKKVGEAKYNFTQLAEKAGFSVLECKVQGTIPLATERKKIHHEIGKLFFEHLLIFTDEGNMRQVWEAQVKEPEKPRRIVSFSWKKGQDPEDLYQRLSGVFFSFEEDEKGDITIIDVVERLRMNFAVNSEKVTKKFYVEFKKHHSSFMDFIDGIDDHISSDDNKNKQWYASLMLNRLMFCYFIQRKGFLDGDRKYLENKLKACKAYQGTNFYNFYRSFLLKLFHNGLGKPQDQRNEELPISMGNIPYLNGGLFDVHELEKQFEEINIDDDAFEKIFGFFSQWNWHLDTSEEASGKDINPDVIGYIFEKYINDRADMGAYYTKEDITDYISKNTILPFLMDETQRNYSKAFTPNGEIWSILQESGDTYIYNAVKKGAELPLPQEIEVGLETVSQRGEWNKTADSDYALPTEIWREVVDRRKRYNEVFTRIKSGDIRQINDFITYNLNIRQFVQDILEDTEDPEFIKHFYKSLHKITIIDPTCGSGAFLFAALNILEPLYESCIQRMESFVSEGKSGEFKIFESVLENINSPQHPNRKYFIYKTIILHNLYGVDIMKEAVEIAKLRLFLKLVAVVDVDPKKDNMGLEPLPDIDFNIRAGNALVGIGNEFERKKALDYTLDGVISQPIIDEKCEMVARAFKRYKEIQLSYGDNFHSFKNAKDDLNNRLKELNKEFNILYHKQAVAIPFDKWKESHQPFHWFAEFYEIVKENGGFDIIIGNPPYLERRQINYQPKGLKTIESGAVHNMCIERSLQILKNTGNISMIVPLSLVCTQRMTMVQKLLEEHRTTWYSNFAWRPGKLFDNVNRALTIFVSNYTVRKDVFSTNYIKWSSNTREDLFPDLSFSKWQIDRNTFWMPKLGNIIEESILKKVLDSNSGIAFLVTRDSSNRVYYRTTGGLYWKIFTNFSPKFIVNGQKGKSSRETFFAVKERNQELISICLLSSNLFWWWYTITSNLRDLNPSDIQGFKFPSSVLNSPELIILSEKYLKDLENNSTMLKRIQKQTGEIETQSFKISLSKPILDEIDSVLAKHYHFTEEELDFVINYDIKYRMGRELDDDDE